MENIYLSNYQKIFVFCGLLFSFQLTFAQTPAPTGVTSDQIVCYDTPMSLTATCSKGIAKWYNESNVFLSNVALNFNATQTATYTVKCLYNAVFSVGVPVTITVNRPFNVTREQSLCHCDELDLKASCPNADVVWYGSDTTFPISTGPIFHIAPDNSTTYNVRCEKTDSDVPCISPFDTFTIYVYSTLNDDPTGVTVSPAICLGESLTLDGTCSGTAQPFFYLNDGITEINPVITNLTTSTTYKVRCESLDLCPSAFTDINVTVNAATAPAIISTSTSICKGESILLDATCDVGADVVWYENDGITQIDNTHLLVTPSSDVTYKVRCEVSGDCSSVFDSTTITLTSDIITQPVSTLVCLGDNATFVVDVSGTPTFQWQKKQDNGTFVDIPAGITNTLVISNVTLEDRGYYRCHIVGSCDFYTDEVFLSFPQTIITKNKEVPANVTILDEFGNASAVSDSLAVVGAWSKANYKGAAYVYKMNPGGKWSQIAQLSPADLLPDDSFGAAVAISGDTVFVSAPGQNADMGAVYIFTKETDGTWIQLDKIESPNHSSDDYFGGSISVSNGLLAVGADGWESVFIYKRDEMGIWNYETELFENFSTYYGYSVSISGKNLVVGAPDDGAGGAVFVYEKDEFDIWQSIGRYVPDNLDSGAGFGFATAISGNTIIASGYVDPTGESIVQVFERDAVGNWFPKTKLSSADISDEGGLGYSIAIRDNIAVLGAPGNFVGKGAAVVFERNTAGNWVQKKLLIPSGLVIGDLFGTSVALSKTSILACASFLSSPFPPEVSKGGAYFYSLSTSIPAITNVQQVAAICSSQKATFILTGFPSTETYTVTYKIDFTGTEKTTVVTPDSTGKATFTETLLWANNTKNIYITKVKNNATNCEKTIEVIGELSLKAPTQITGGPNAQIVCVGETAVFMVEATGEGTLNFQWQRQTPSSSGFGTPLNNDFSDISVLTLANRTLADNGALYRAKVTGECGIATSGDAPLTVLPKAIVTITAGPPVCPGTNATVVLSGTPGAEVHYESNGFSAFTILDGSGVATISTGPIVGPTTYNLVSVNIFGKCNRTLSGSVVVDVLPTGASIPSALVLTSPTNDVANTVVSNYFAQNIQSTNKIEAGGKSDQIGNKYVLLGPGFEAAPGSIFLAKISPSCP
ncbi:immunoglobulin domain-containing protein [Emticicia sp. BO119]|uniref:immunoglobulin domain-containing protein n=1 Tax=Emticicia sp. BO119 TaxID=2757768 RepID=UPI0015EFE345|nr:immunoglobulin domain-containing protein [Emticicia sp. BO119]MBA4849619.1 immunoglobulin domain-containing protein [Emticicia sp. BO119]